MRQRLAPTIGVVIGIGLTVCAGAWLGRARLEGFRAAEPASTADPDRDGPLARSSSRSRPDAQRADSAATATTVPSTARSEADPTRAASDHPGSAQNESRPTAGTGHAVPDPAQLSPAELDTAPPEAVRSALERAVAEARTKRPLTIAPALLARAAEQGSVRVIFGTRPGEDAARLSRMLDYSGGRTDPVDDLRVFPLLGSGAARLSTGALLRLIRETPTERIELDGLHRPSLLSSVALIGADVAHEDGQDGDGFAVAVIDTGVDGDHPMLASRLIEEACFSVGGNCPNDASVMLGAGAAAPCGFEACDHGTHVAGIAVGDAAPNPLVGVAPRAQLIAINVFSDVGGEAAAYSSDILAAMQHVLALTSFHEIAAVNLSLGGDAFTSEAACDTASPSMLGAVAQLRGARVATVAAAGNDGFTNAISSPACLSNILAVGSVGDADGPSAFSNSAEFLALLAPGESIVSAAVGGGTRSANGTSMATPHVAGALAAIREALPDATVEELEGALALAGEPILDDRNGITTPRIQVDRTIETLRSASANPDDDESASSSTGGSGGSAGGGGGGGGGCGLIGVEPFLVLPLVRIGLRASRRAAGSPA